MGGEKKGLGISNLVHGKLQVDEHLFHLSSVQLKYLNGIY